MRRLMPLSTPWCFWGVVWMVLTQDAMQGHDRVHEDVVQWGHAAHSCLPLPPHAIDVSHFHCLSSTHALHALHCALALSTNVSHTTPSNIKSMDVTKIRQIHKIHSSHKRCFSPERCGREEGRMRALVAGYRNMAAILECSQHPSGRAIQNF